MTTKQPKTLTAIKKLLVDTLEDHKAQSIITIDTRKLTDVADYLIIASGNSTTHVKALADKIREALRLHHIKLLGSEGEETREWVLIDIGHVIVHIMLPKTREFYSLEKLWQIPLKKVTAAKTRSKAH
jgi:ribosome-associated protein